MDGINSLADLDPSYKKVDKWKPKKLKHYDMGTRLVTAYTFNNQSFRSNESVLP